MAAQIRTAEFVRRTAAAPAVFAFFAEVALADDKHAVIGRGYGQLRRRVKHVHQVGAFVTGQRQHAFVHHHQRDVGRHAFALYGGIDIHGDFLPGAVEGFACRHGSLYFALCLRNGQIDIARFTLRLGQVQPFFVIFGLRRAAAYQRYAHKHIGQVRGFDGHLHIVRARSHGHRPRVQHAFALHGYQSQCAFIGAFDQNARRVAGVIFFFVLLQLQNIVVVLFPVSLAFAIDGKGKAAFYLPALRVFGGQGNLVRAGLRGIKREVIPFLPHRERLGREIFHAPLADPFQTSGQAVFAHAEIFFLLDFGLHFHIASRLALRRNGHDVRFGVFSLLHAGRIHFRSQVKIRRV